MFSVENKHKIWKLRCSQSRYTFMNLPSFESYVPNRTVDYMISWDLRGKILEPLTRLLGRDYE